MKHLTLLFGFMLIGCQGIHEDGTAWNPPSHSVAPECDGFGGGNSEQREFAVMYATGSTSFIGTPMAGDGARTAISIERAKSGDAAASVVSRDPSILSITEDSSPRSCVRTIKVKTGVPGSAKVAFLADDGTELDFVTLQVAQVKELRILGDMQWVGTTELPSNTYESIHFDTIGSSGSHLVGSGGVHFEYEGSIKPSDPIVLFGAPADIAYFQTTTPGSATLRARSGTTELAISIEVVAP